MKIILSQGPVSFGFPPTMDGNAQQSVEPVCLEPILDINVQGDFTPNGLTTSYDKSDDGRTITLHLRQGVKFHDGTDFNAQAAKWNLDQNIAAKIYGTTYMQSTEVVDNYTVKINMKQADFTVINSLGNAACVVISPTAFEKNGKDWAQLNPVGTGPFKFKSFKLGESLEYVKNENYWNKNLPYLDGITFLYIADSMVASAALQSGAADVYGRVEGLQATTLRDAGFTVIAPAKQWGNWLTPDSKNADSPLANKTVREALEYATNKPAIAQLGYGFISAVNQIGDPDYPASWIPDFKGREYNSTKAKELLAQAGYPNGLKIQVIFQVEMGMQDAMVALQNQWKAVGVALTLNAMPRAAYVEARTKGWNNGELLVQTGISQMWTSTLDRIFAVQGNTYVSTQRPPNWGQLMSDANASPDLKTYQERTHKMTQAAFDFALAIPISSQTFPYLTAKYVHDGGWLERGLSLWTPSVAWMDR